MSNDRHDTAIVGGVRKQRVLILPGNGCAPIECANWYRWLQRALNETSQYDAVCEEMPDPDRARRDIWLPFIRDTLHVDTDTIIVGHSSGAEAAMRLAETDSVKGLVLVSACHTDLGVENERQSGWYDGPWQWSAIRQHTQWIVQLHSTDDPFIAMSEAEYVAMSLHSEFHRHTGRGHYLTRKLADIVTILNEKRMKELASAEQQ